MSFGSIEELKEELKIEESKTKSEGLEAVVEWEVSEHEDNDNQVATSSIIECKKEVIE